MSLCLLLCSCKAIAPPTAAPKSPLEAVFPSRQHARSPATQPVVPAGYSAPVVPAGYPLAMPYACPPGNGFVMDPGFVPGYAPSPGLVQLPITAWTGTEPSPDPWRPPHIRGPWPPDEYLFDGGDREGEVEVAKDGALFGMDTEDTIAHYDTRDGETHVQPSNRVPIYAPRFASVRKVYGVKLHEQLEWSNAAEQRTPLGRIDESLPSPTVTQPVQLGRLLATKDPNVFRDRNRSVGYENVQRLTGMEKGESAYANFKFIRTGEHDNSEKLRLWQRVQAAITWAGDQQTQVVIEGQMAYEGRSRAKVQEEGQYEMPPGKPRLRIVKIASKDNAQPGEEVDFTLRFDNVGDQTIGNVTIIDNLTTRLDYVPDTQTCGVGANFSSQENEGESLVLRWELTEPLRVREGGVIRFKCRVR